MEKKPLFLMADSQLLFWKKGDDLFLRTILSDYADRQDIKAAYVGASNGDQPEFYDIFVAAMEQIPGIHCRMIQSKPTKKDEDFFGEAEVVLLAGGDVELGMQVMQENGIGEKVVKKYYDGGTIIGVSAGAVQLGVKGWRRSHNGGAGPVDTLKIIPYAIDVHDEAEDWEWLGKAVKEFGEHTRGFGIPFGGGALFYPDWSLEAVRHSVTEISFTGEEIKQSIILPS